MSIILPTLLLISISAYSLNILCSFIIPYESVICKKVDNPKEIILHAIRVEYSLFYSLE